MNRIYIVCTGASLQGFNFSPLEFYDTIAVNFAYKYFKAKHIVGLDREFWLRADMTGQTKLRHSVKNYNKDESFAQELGVELWTSRHFEGWDKPPYISHGYNSAHTALHIAIHLGYTDIRILGMDLVGGYFYDPNVQRSDTFPGYEHLNMKLKKFTRDMPKGIRIRNYSINSLCTALDKKELKDWNE